MRLGIVFGLATLGVIAIKPNQAKPANGSHSPAYRQGMFQQQQAGPPARGFLPQQQQAGPYARGFLPQQQQFAGPAARLDSAAKARSAFDLSAPNRLNREEEVCPESVEVTITGDAVNTQGGRRGTYTKAGESEGHPYYSYKDQSLWYITEQEPGGTWGAKGGPGHWMIGYTTNIGLHPNGGLWSRSAGPCPQGREWEYHAGNDVWPEAGEMVMIAEPGSTYYIGCPDELNVVLAGLSLQEQDDDAGKYIKAGTINGLPYWKHETKDHAIWAVAPGEKNGEGEFMIGNLENLGTNWGGFHAQADPETKCPTDLAWMVNGPDGWVDAGEDAKVMDAAAARFLPQQQQQQRFQQQQWGGPPARFLPQQQQRFQQQQWGGPFRSLGPGGETETDPSAMGSKQDEQDQENSNKNANRIRSARQYRQFYTTRYG